MSYLTWLVARQGAYWSRPKVLIPEKTESAWMLSTERILNDLEGGCKYLGATVAWQRVIPEALVRPLDRSLVIVMAVGVR